MNSTLTSTFRGLNLTAFGLLHNIDPTRYGYTPLDEQGNMKYPGYLVGQYNGSDGEVGIIPGGHLGNSEASTLTLMRKFTILTNNPTFSGSITGRDPKRGRWGGAIRSTSDGSVFFGATGFPEIVDHLLVACVMFECRVLTLTAFNEVTSQTYLREACLDRHMTTEQFMALRTWIHNMAKARCTNL